MPLTSYPIDRFSGIDLLNDPQEVGASAAIDMLNVDLDRRGRVRTRDGWALVSATAATTTIAALGYFLDSTSVEWIVAGDSTTLRPYKTSDGSAGTTQAGVVSSNNAFARFGDTSNVRLYVAAGTLYRFTGSAWASVVAPINPLLAAVTANDNRLVIANTTTESKIHFSDAGAPETFGASNFVTLWPGDGEGITALVRWRDKLFAFKRSRFAVFGGTSIDATGNPIFNYYGVDAGHGATTAGAAVAGDEGVYFMDTNGDIYLTTGSDPVYVSGPIEPWVRGKNTTLPQPSFVSLPALAYVGRRLIVNYGGVQAVLDTQTGQWMMWQLAASALLGVGTNFSPGIYLGDTATKKVGLCSPAATTDNGTAIAWRYQSGFYDMGAPDQEKVLRMSRLTGTGTVTLSRFRDYATSDTNAAAIALGSTTTELPHLKSWRGTLMSHKLSGTGVASVSGLAHEIRTVRAAGMRSA